MGLPAALVCLLALPFHPFWPDYEAARRGDIPTIRVGRLLRVSVAVMERKVDQG